ncbi:hypothetical protein HYU21_01875, partial [Candidatus Woesearchaeota archaeon]|nr:hypothetical protein [Candidatus Woesearchaeota archaeon]
MPCHKCLNPAVIKMQHGDLCASHFLSYFEDKVFQTIQDYRLLERNDTICVAASGGKDSLGVWTQRGVIAVTIEGLNCQMNGCPTPQELNRTSYNG